MSRANSNTVLSADEFMKRLMSHEVEARRKAYRACYMSWVDGIVTDPRLMMISLDDHMVHRGDGVFEALKIVDKKPYLLQSHLERLQKSAELISLKLPMGLKEIENKLHETLEVSGLSSAIARLFVSRGVGSFGPNPYDSTKSGFSLVVTELKPVAAEKYEKGVRIGKSRVAPKPGFWAQIKSCNYLPNVLMKKESVDRGLEFTVSFDELGFLAESSTENIILVDAEGRLCQPHLDRILKGCTMTRVMELARDHGVAQHVTHHQMTEKDVLHAQEVMMVGTTLDVLPVTEYEGLPIGPGYVGPIAQKLQTLLIIDQR